MGLFSRKQPVENKDKLPSAESITLYAEDDNMTRAEKIVRVLGYRGATASFEKEVWRVCYCTRVSAGLVQSNFRVYPRRNCMVRGT